MQPIMRLPLRHNDKLNKACLRILNFIEEVRVSLMIRNLSFSTFFTFTFFLFVSTPTSAKEPENLHKLKQAVIFYHDSGEYAYD